jgi:5'-phosphate synthase pdxT subunit
VLALQGDVSEHARAIERAGASAGEVRTPSELDTVDGLIIPGGESTTVGKLLQRFGLLDPLRARIEAGMPVYGTCTGLILLARDIEEGMEGQPLLGKLDVRVRRNAFGRQRESFEADLDLDLPDQPPGPFRGVFIRAPLVVSVGDGVEVLGRHEGEIVAVRQGTLLATAFHPELTGDARLHAHFAAMCRA